eukprot:CAMPEP_0115149110 /NCGR_PEP_ID=MMETSP0227-20121206/64260_1 /TAXON_ID=89957 /ORGANISM="Polarella glacialis, Strain CCMP 1383" /LENGTH=30 /DNA_ID= /DNA_START= /DNA_END= /DNA_ORIENTATION=
MTAQLRCPATTQSSGCTSAPAKAKRANQAE